MKVRDNPPLHLTYCLNIHPGESWEENFDAIRTKSLKIRQKVAPSTRFGLGLRLGSLAVDGLMNPNRLQEFKTFLNENDLYVFTVNGFPYGSFHTEIVKEKAYHPDWGTTSRRDYTIKLGDVLSELLPEGLSGSISTVPGSYRTWIRSEKEKTEIIRNIMECIAHFSKLRDRKGCEIQLALEPEPDCLLETTDDVLSFFTRDLRHQGINYLAELLGCPRTRAEEIIARHLGICLDTCHLAVQGENLSGSLALLKQNGIRVSKVQISSALEVTAAESNLRRLRWFLDSTYLHQVRVYRDGQRIYSYRDLSEALQGGFLNCQQDDIWKIHFHVPLYFEGDDGFVATSRELTSVFFEELVKTNTTHLEIETYTFDVLPGGFKVGDVVLSVILEYQWVIDRLQA